MWNFTAYSQGVQENIRVEREAMSFSFRVCLPSIHKGRTVPTAKTFIVQPDAYLSNWLGSSDLL